MVCYKMCALASDQGWLCHCIQTMTIKYWDKGAVVSNDETVASQPGTFYTLALMLLLAAQAQ